jgi:RNA recognition motif-containing protein
MKYRENGQSRGFGFVIFQDSQSALDAMAAMNDRVGAACNLHGSALGKNDVKQGGGRATEPYAGGAFALV